MASTRELILARLPLIAAATPGINAAVRNAADATGLIRPMILIQDGSEAIDTTSLGGGVPGAKPHSERLSRRQRMALTPEIFVLAFGTEPNVGTLLNLCAERFLAQVTHDTELLALVGIDPVSGSGVGEIRYEGCMLEPAVATSKERRLLLTISFTYVFQMADVV